MNVRVPFTWPALGDKYPRTASLQLTITAGDRRVVQVIRDIHRDATSYQLMMPADEATYLAELQGVGYDGTLGQPARASFTPNYVPPEPSPAFEVGHVVPAEEPQ